MPSSFFELSVASTGLFTSKGAINVVSHNIANADTVGYSRQLALVRARSPLSYQNGRGMIGTGSEVYGVGQMRNFYLDTKYWTNKGVLGEYTAKSAQNRLLQVILNETDDTGFNAMVNDVFGIINRDLVPDSSSLTARTSLINSAQALAQYFNTTYAALQKQQSDINMEIKNVVSNINNIGLQIKNLNQQITLSELDGSQANDLRDSRALLVDQLSQYVNVEVREVELNKNLLTGESEKHFQVLVNGYDFVDHYNLNKLTCVERTVKNNVEDVDGIYDIYWTNGVKFNSEFSLATMSGELKGLLVTRDGNNQNFPSASISSTTPIGTSGRYELTFAVDSATRLDWPINGTITIDGKNYAYSNYQCTYNYNSATDKWESTITIEVPPADGKLTVGTAVLNYSDFTVDAAAKTVSFTLEKEMSAAELKSKIKIGDMVLNGTIVRTVNPDGTMTVEISDCQAAVNIGALAVAGPASSVKVGQSIDYKGLPYFMAKLNTFVRGLAMTFNLGRDASGNKLDGVTGHYDSYNLMKYEDDANDNTGYNFFSYTTAPNSPLAGKDIPYLDYHLMNAGNFSVSKELLENPRALACALSENPDISDSTAIAELLGLKHNPHVFDEGEIGNYIESIIGELGIVTKLSLTFESNYTDITEAVDYQRLSISSVSLDEEMASMIYWQQIYNACAKMISTLNGIYDTTINKLGL